MPDEALDLDSTTHWVVPFAAVDPSIAPPPLPHLQALLAHLRERARHAGAEQDPLAPHERVLAQAHGVSGWPGAALDSDAPHTPQAWVHPVHLQVGMGEVTLQPAELFGLDEAGARRLFDALSPLCAEDGVELRFENPTRWRAVGERLRGLRCASLDQVAGRSIAPWLPQGDEAPWLQRLMNEAQMLFYTHPVNDAREAARQLPVNGVWFSAAGAREGNAATDVAPRVADHLRLSALQGDASAWRAAWAALDASLMDRLLQRALRRQPFSLTLCGEHHAVTLEAAPPGAWQRLARTLGLAHRPNAHELLKTL